MNLTKLWVCQYFSSSFFFFKNHEFILLTTAHFSRFRFSLRHPSSLPYISIQLLVKMFPRFCPLSLWMYDLCMLLHFFLFLIITCNLSVAKSAILHHPKYNFSFIFIFIFSSLQLPNLFSVTFPNFLLQYHYYLSTQIILLFLLWAGEL